MERALSEEFLPLRDQRCALHALTRKPTLLQALSTPFLPPTCPMCSHRVWSTQFPLCHLCDRERLLVPWLTAPIELPLNDNSTMQLYVQWHYSPFIRLMIHKAKFTPVRKLFSFLGVQLDKTFKIIHPQLYTSHEELPLLIPIPPSDLHFRTRLFNQALLLAKELSFGTVADLLHRDPRSLPQSSLDVRHRKRNMLPALTVNKRLHNIISGRNIILVDDIIGSGSTMSAARNILMNNGASSVKGASIAISPLFR